MNAPYSEDACQLLLAWTKLDDPKNDFDEDDRKQDFRRFLKTLRQRAKRVCEKEPKLLASIDNLDVERVFYTESGGLVQRSVGFKVLLKMKCQDDGGALLWKAIEDFCKILGKVHHAAKKDQKLRAELGRMMASISSTRHILGIEPLQTKLRHLWYQIFICPTLKNTQTILDTTRAVAKDESLLTLFGGVIKGLGLLTLIEPGITKQPEEIGGKPEPSFGQSVEIANAVKSSLNLMAHFAAPGKIVETVEKREESYRIAKSEAEKAFTNFLETKKEFEETTYILYGDTHRSLLGSSLDFVIALGELLQCSEEYQKSLVEYQANVLQRSKGAGTGCASVLFSSVLVTNFLKRFLSPLQAIAAYFAGRISMNVFPAFLVLWKDSRHLEVNEMNFEVGLTKMSLQAMATLCTFLQEGMGVEGEPSALSTSEERASITEYAVSTLRVATEAELEVRLRRLLKEAFVTVEKWHKEVIKPIPLALSSPAESVTETAVLPESVD
ncbi:hypothetical protein BJ508DRAFT_418748 [Ascobolus immersus RN42]|uniref:Uncharacterized protein n=1 Tax=Ascobolus immersus RN42 TaxID=1160509 RepID=A0A3N4HQ04_ASCIM|nr:hypothetical protein BJ508DRAFT_418748 [Ascobolus immersus RN42]